MWIYFQIPVKVAYFECQDMRYYINCSPIYPKHIYLAFTIFYNLMMPTTPTENYLIESVFNFITNWISLPIIYLISDINQGNHVLSPWSSWNLVRAGIIYCIIDISWFCITRWYIESAYTRSSIFKAFCRTLYRLNQTIFLYLQFD